MATTDYALSTLDADTLRWSVHATGSLSALRSMTDALDADGTGWKIEPRDGSADRIVRDTFIPEAEIARDRDESEPCEAGTIGCCVRHAAAPSPRHERSCETW